MRKHAYEVEAFSCEREGLTIRGHCFMPSDVEGPVPTIILSHGFMANETTNYAYAKVAATLGYAAYAFDFCGGCVDGTSDGDSRDMSVLTEKRDVCAVLDHVLAQPTTAAGGVWLFGCSQGGLASALAAAERPQDVAHLVLYYPALCASDFARKGLVVMTRFDVNDIPDVIDCGPMEVGRVYVDDLLGMDVYAEIVGYHGPVTIAHGTDDELVPIDYSRRALVAYRDVRAGDAAAAPCCLYEIEGGTHGFRRHAERCARQVLAMTLQEGRDVRDLLVSTLG